MSTYEAENILIEALEHLQRIALAVERSAEAHERQVEALKGIEHSLDLIHGSLSGRDGP